MKVVDAISDTNIGGAGILLLMRLKNSDRKKIQSTVILPKGSALRPRFSDIDIPTIEVDGCYDRSFDIHAIKRYRKILQEVSPDLINCHGCMSCRIAARQSRVPVSIYTRHCAYPPKKWQESVWGRALIGQGQRLLSDHIIAVAEAAKENLIAMGTAPSPISVIINGVEPLQRFSQQARDKIRKILAIPESAFVIGIFARLEACKGHAIFLKAAQRLLAQSERFYFLIVGSGSLASELKRDSQQKGLTSHVRFTGFAEDVSPYMNITDILVNCSVGTETSSLALSEAMSLRIPCVVSDYGGNPYMVKHGNNGLVYPKGNSTVLAEQLKRLSEDRILYDQLSENAYHRFCTELNAQNMTAQTEALYEKLWEDRKESFRCRASHRQS